MLTFLSIALFAAVLYPPTRKRLDDAVHVIFTGKTMEQEKRDNEREAIEIELRLAARLAEVDLTDEQVRDVSLGVVDRRVRREDQS